VDPGWTWAPFEFPGTGSLVLNDGHPVGLWIHLTIGGVSKPGYGSCDKGKPEAMKELIGDAIRNAGLSFGIAWKLWAKGERNGNDSGAANSRQQDESFENATAAPARQRGAGNGQPANGQAVRPAQAPRPPAAANGEIDEEAQAIADEVHQTLTVDALKALNTKAREAHKLAALIRNPGTGGTGGLGQYITWKKTSLEKADKALAALLNAAKTAGISEEEMEHRVMAACGKGVEDATAEELTRAAELITQGAAA
jgi:hypothetical protein